MLSERPPVQFSINPSVGVPVFIPQPQAKGPYKLLSVKNTTPPTPLRRPSANAEYGYRWNDESILRCRLMMEEEPTRRYTDDQVQAVRERAREYGRRLQLIDTIPQADYWRRQDAYQSFSFARYLLLWRIFPINDLPPEILSHIFRFVALSSRTPKEAVNSRLHLTWVCRHWRGLAIGDPVLWSTVWFRLRRHSVGTFSSPCMERSLAWLERASQAVLDVMITALPQHLQLTPLSSLDAGKADTHIVHQLLHLIAPKLPQLRTLIVGLESPMCDLAFQILYNALSAGLVPARLEHLEIRRLEAERREALPTISNQAPLPFLGSEASALRYLALDGVTVEWSQSSFGNLTSLEISSTHFKNLPNFDMDLPRILRCCPNLEELGLGAGFEKLSAEGMDVEPVPLDQLHSLTFYETAPSNVSCLLCMFTAPCLRSLTLSHMGSEDCIILFSGLMGRFPELRYLALEELETSENDHAVNVMIRWFLSTPDLRYFKAKNTCESCVFDALLYVESSTEQPALRATPDPPKEILTSNYPLKSGKAIVCPKLALLEVHVADVDSVIEFAQQRQALGAPLKKIYAGEGLLADLEKDDVADLQEASELWILPAGQNSPESQELRRPASLRSESNLWA
ncbi:hypothetical protein GLOTRDRAFT_135118 [Gloeophyllum trabeum ATCC 11539]|uniref:F-box domain-containing protein n=1 Tax=Gloeophyllum trabeum (strain ATCC 11539 / FP-39264 / Madison 617) TaxID=670483 RepID=S7S3M9_GLOTA|nr:uncharacterized protein GLOTRDRAFT_135118 [Gloeophyllum trabeum ATCC 11539]EPQ60434.1 hypothetical protein GLOTRDRAFT_135118 [Gloeophyllum trabeum ATCC 11539]